MTTRRSSRKQATPLHGSSGSGGWFTGLLVGLVIGGGVVFYLLAVQPKNQNTAPADVTSAKPATTEKKKTGPRFDFYQLLPENATTPSTTPQPTVTASSPTPASGFDADTENTTTGVPVETHAATPDSKVPGAYLLQAGAFRAQADADKVRANIILLGFSSRVETAKNNKGETIYRVLVGSFATQDEAQRAQSTLSKNKIPAVISKQK